MFKEIYKNHEATNADLICLVKFILKGNMVNFL